MGLILLQYGLIRVWIADADEDGNHVRWRHLQLLLHDVVLLIQRDAHRARQALGGGSEEDVFYHAPGR